MSTLLRQLAFGLAAALASSLLLALALPPAAFGFLGWVAVLPILLSTRGRGLLAGFVVGLLAIFGAALWVLSGLFYSQATYRGDPGWVWSGCGLYGFVIALVCAVNGELRKRSVWTPLTLAALAVILECSMQLVLPSHLALTQWRSMVWVESASIMGIWGVSLLMWLVQAWATEQVASGKWRATWVLVVPATLSVLPWLSSSPPGRPLKVAAVQTDRTDRAGWVRRLERLRADRVQLAVWPEFGGQELAFRDTEELKALSRDYGVAFATSFPDGWSPLPHNAEALFSGGRESARYFKRMLFGGETKMHTPGRLPGAAELMTGLSVGLNVCYDSCYPYVLRDTVRLRDVSVITLPTHDPESPYGFLAAEHAAFTPFRAAECGVPIVRSDGLSYSLIVAPTGQIVAEGDSFGDMVVMATVDAQSHWTLSRALGDWVAWLCGAYLCVSLGLVVRRRFKPPM